MCCRRDLISSLLQREKSFNTDSGSVNICPSGTEERGASALIHSAQFLETPLQLSRCAVSRD